MLTKEKRTVSRQVDPLRAPKTGAMRDPDVAYCRAYRRRQDIFLLIRQLNQLTKGVQRHRGMSMGLLAGSPFFRGDFAVLQRQLERLLRCLEVLVAETGLLSEREKANLHGAWETIRADWQDDDVIDNFELHSHFIIALQGIVTSLARMLERPVSDEIAEEFGLEAPEIQSGYPQMFKQIELLNFATRQAPEMIEQVARIRGLATYAAARKQCDIQLERKLRYAIGCARSANEKLRLQAERLEGLLGGAVPTLSMVKTYELKLMFLLNTVEMDILSGASITAESRQLFKLASEIVDVYLQVVEDSMDAMAGWHQQDMETWVGYA